MADIFLSYASPDRDRARLVAGALEHRGWSVWWDRTIPPGRAFDEVIEEALTAARCVVVLWSTSSISSDWVKTEAAEAARRRVLVPALIDQVKIPLEFRRLQAADLTSWSGAIEDAEFAKLAASVAPLLGRPVTAAEQPPLEPPKRKHISRRAWALAGAALAVTLLSVALVTWTITTDVTVPSVIGQSVDRARSTIAASNLIAGDVTDEPTDKQTPGLVLKQDPTAGARVKKGAPVALIVASTPGPAAQPASGGTSAHIDPGLANMGIGIAFNPKELAIHVMFVPDDSALGGLFTVGGPGGMVIQLESGPAMKAGIQAGDVITAIGGIPVRSENDLRQALRKIGVGVTRFTIKRGAQELKLDVNCPDCKN